MKTGRLFVPAFGISAILTLVAVYNWVIGGKNLQNTLLWAAVVVCLWGLYILVARKRA